MLEAARIDATIQVLTEIMAAWERERPLPADVVMHRYFKERRYIGSKDRGAIAEMVYFCIRNLATLSWWCERSGMLADALNLVLTALVTEYKKPAASLFTGEKYAPPSLTPTQERYIKSLTGGVLLHDDMPDAARYNFPAWLEPQLKESFGNAWKKEMAALNEEAPVDLRTNTLLTSREVLLRSLKDEGYDVAACERASQGIRMQKRAPIFTSPRFKEGWFEMQDEGSQVVSEMIPIKAGDKVIDFCAGAGGKTLALAARMNNKGRILAWDTSQKRLDQMKPRLKRAKVDNVQTHVIESESDAFIKRHKESADAVIIDAPCSGLGTWRRNPDLKWRFQEKDLTQLVDVQQRILQSASRLVKKNGYLLYITCSLLHAENEKQVQAFLSLKDNFRVVTPEKIWNNPMQQTVKQGDYLRLTPHKDGTDGFFAALFQRSN